VQSSRSGGKWPRFAGRFPRGSRILLYSVQVGVTDKLTVLVVHLAPTYRAVDFVASYLARGPVRGLLVPRTRLGIA
jgi:hypothetical protein